MTRLLCRFLLFVMIAFGTVAPTAARDLRQGGKLLLTGDARDPVAPRCLEHRR